MAYYHVEVGYSTKRGGVALGMTIKAFGPDEAVEIAEERTLSKFPARKHHWEATALDLKLGCVNETKASAPVPGGT